MKCLRGWETWVVIIRRVFHIVFIKKEKEKEKSRSVETVLDAFL